MPHVARAGSAANRRQDKEGSKGVIYFLIRSLNRGGAERQLVTLAKELHDRGYQVNIAVYYAGGHLDQEVTAHGIQLIDLRKRGRWDLIGFSYRLIRSLKDAQPDILYSFLGTSNLLSALVKPILPRMISIWSIRASNVDLRSYDPILGLGYKLECALSRNADLVISNSVAGAEHAVRNGFPREKMRVVPNGIDTGQFFPDETLRNKIRDQWGVAPHELLVGMLARLDPMKDHPTFIRAAAKVAEVRPEVRFACIGDGQAEYRSRLVRLAEDAGISDRMLWPGLSEEPNAALNALDLCCSSSAWGEGFSNAVAEAMSAGVSCVVTDVGDSASIVGDIGKVVPVGDPKALAEAIVAALNERGPRQSVLARQRIQENFSVRAMVDRTVALMDRGRSSHRLTHR